MESEFVSIEQAGEILGLHIAHVAQKLQSGDLTRVPKSEVPPDQRRPKCRTYIRRAELMDRRTLAEKNGWVSSKEAGEILGIQQQSVLHRAETGQLTPLYLPSYCGRKGKFVFFLRSEVEAARYARPVRNLPDYTYSTEPTDLAYLAGFIDGEGTICIRYTRRVAATDGYCVSLQAVNTDLTVMAWIGNTFGSSPHAVKRNRPEWRTVYTWCQTGCTAYQILCLILPFLKVKREQALLAIEFHDRLLNYNAGLWNPLTDDELAWRQEQKEKISALNGGRFLK